MTQHFVNLNMGWQEREDRLVGRMHREAREKGIKNSAQSSKIAGEKIHKEVLSKAAQLNSERPDISRSHAATILKNKYFPDRAKSTIQSDLEGTDYFKKYLKHKI